MKPGRQIGIQAKRLSVGERGTTEVFAQFLTTNYYSQNINQRKAISI